MEYLILAGALVLAFGLIIIRLFRSSYQCVSEWQASFTEASDQASGADW